MKNLRLGYDIDSLHLGELHTKHLVFLCNSIAHALHAGLYIKSEGMSIGGRCFVMDDYGYLSEVIV